MSLRLLYLAVRRTTEPGTMPTGAHGWVGDPCGGGFRAAVTCPGLGIVTRPVAPTGGDRWS